MSLPARRLGFGPCFQLVTNHSIRPAAFLNLSNGFKKGPAGLSGDPIVVILYETGYLFRQIFTDGRPLPKDPQPAWLGYSVGKWEGDTLVVDTIGFQDQGWLDGNKGHPQTDAMHVTERFRRVNFGHLEIQATVDDPKAYTKPFTVKQTLHLLADSEILENICNENEKDATHLVGK